MKKLRLVLVETEGSVNLGMIARLCDNFEVDELFLVNPKTSIDEAKEYAVKAAYRLEDALIVESLEEALQDVELSICTSAKTSKTDILREAIAVSDAAQLYSQADGIVALVMGRESVGLTRNEIKKCDILSYIPSSSKYPALNLANATAIYLYEFYRARLKEQEEPVVRKKTLNLLSAYTRALSDVLIHDKLKRESVEIAVRRIATKAINKPKEIELLLYLLSKACRRIDECEDKVSSYL